MKKYWVYENNLKKPNMKKWNREILQVNHREVVLVSDVLTKLDKRINELDTRKATTPKNKELTKARIQELIMIKQKIKRGIEK